MGKKLSQFWYFIGAFVVANVTSFVYHMNSAFAAPAGYVGAWDSACKVTQTIDSNYYCTPSNPKFPNLAGAPCGTDWRNLCIIEGLAAQQVWGCVGTVYPSRSSGYCNCSTVSVVTGVPRYSARLNNAGLTYFCSSNGSGAYGYGGTLNKAAGVVCNSMDAGWPSYAGYHGIAGLGCFWCPEWEPSDGTQAYGPSSTVMPSVMYAATAVSGCYITGVLGDEKGLFEYSDENRCYYSS